ncbi:MAG: hypothetical protein COA42_12470 [Alteromonadaceae bacterium]|nr:MAG: hypothetical protein COA42_12470 [Alteromonadaceae bacterium]
MSVPSSTTVSIAVTLKTVTKNIARKAPQVLVFILGLALSVLSHAMPTFSVAFSPTTIGPSSTSTLTYTIDNSAQASAVTGMNFSNTLPTGVVIASPSRASTNCVDGQFSATPGANTLTFSDYRLSAQTTCTLSVDVTSVTPGAHVNTTDTLTTNAGNVSTANATLTVDAARPGISMAFVPSTINQGAVSRLTFTIDNNLNGNSADFLFFQVNSLAHGLVISDQPEATSTCTGGTLPPVIIAVPGTSSIAFSTGFTASGASCTASVNVTAELAGQFVNISSQLSQNGSDPAGISSALLTVNNPFLNANFPASVAAGTSVNLTYTLNNTDRDNAATDITFTNDLNAALSGLTATVLPASGFCGSGSTISGSSTITVAGANLASGGSCSFVLTVLIPTNAANGSYTNTTSTVNLTLGSATTKPALSHDLVVNNAPQLSISFIDDPVSAGNDVTLRFTVTNMDTAASVSNLAFIVEYNTAYSGMAIKTLPDANSCGTGSTFTSVVDPDVGIIQVQDGILSAGANCTFDVVMTLPADGISGSFLHTSSAITGTIASSAVTGNKASDTLVALAGPRLSIDITGDSAAPGATVTADFTLEYSEHASADISDLAFTVDLNNALSGLTMASASANDICGSGSSVSGTSTLTFAGGSLAATEQCSFSASLQIPSGTAPGLYTLVSSTVTGTVAAQSVNASAASDTQTVTGLTLSKSFLTSPVAAGGSVILRYTITNSADALAASSIAFTDNLHQALPSLSASSQPSLPCGASSQITGTTNLSFSGGNLAPGGSCEFDVPLVVPGGASAGAYNSSTSDMSATVNGNNTLTPHASDTLFVDALEVFISSTESSPTEASPIPVAIHFTRAVTNFIESDLQITNGTASNFSGSDLAYTVDITPTSFGTVVVTLPANSVDDSVFTGVQNASSSLTIEHVDVPSNVAVTVPATALNIVGVSYTVAGTHTINASNVFLYADSDNDGVADNATILDSDVTANGTWSLAAPLSPQVVNNFVVVWEDRVNRVNRVVNVPTITEVTPNFDPVISGTPSTGVAEDANYSFTPTMTDANTNDTHVFSITNQPSWANFDTATGALTGTPLNANVGTDNSIVITVTDSSSLSASLTAFSISVSNTNDAPVISGTPSTSVVEDAPYSFTPTVNDIDVGDTQTFSIASQPSWASFDTSTGLLSGTPTNDDVGVTNNIVITTTDTGTASDSLTAFSITVSNSNDAPVISGTPATSVAEDASYSFTPTVNDVDSGDTQTFSISQQPSWADFDPATGILNGTPSNADVGVYNNIVITITDTASAADSLSAFSITVTNTNDAPAISGTPATTVAEDANYSFTPVVNDVDSGDTQSFSISGQPSWANFSASTGILSGTPVNDDVGDYNNIVITVTDSASVSDSLAAFSITVSNTNDAPVISGTPNATVAEDAAYSFTPVVNDVDSGDTTSFSINNTPSWASFDADTGTLSGTPINSDVGLSSGIVITVTDGSNVSDSLATFSITVSNTNDAVVISGTPNTSVLEDASYSFTPTTSDDDVGDTTLFSISNQPSWASFNTATGVLNGTPSNSDVGISNNISISVTDSGGAISNLTAFSITVSNTNDAPVISGTPSTTVAEDAAYSFTPVVNDVDSGDTTSFSINNTPSWASFDTNTGTLSGTPSNSDIGLSSGIVITVADGANVADSLAAFSITVSNTNDAVVISGTPSTSVFEDASYSFTPTASDEDLGDTATFSINNQPSWASFDTATGALSGTPSNSDVGVNSNIGISATDSGSAVSNLATFSITVINTNDAPIISGTPSTSATEDASYNFTPTVSDVDVGDSASFSISNQPSWASFDANTGTLSGTPSNNDIGLSSGIVITVTDGASVTDSLAAFSITVNNTNDAVVISGTPDASVLEDSSYSFTPTTSDEDIGDTTTFNISNQPSWASFDNTTGTLSGTPNNSDVGVNSNIGISVTDSGGAVANLATFSITVINTNDAPVISGTPSTSVAEDVSYSFTPTMSDVDVGDSASFSISNQPSWASFTASTGALTGTPSNSDIGTYSSIAISVNDNANASASLTPFTITVSNTNDAPVISGSPATSVNEDANYSFIPTFSDVDVGDSATFSIDNTPSWADFNTSTGALTGTPSNSDVGVTSDIVITVTDSGGASANLATFNLTVVNTNDAPLISGTPNSTVAEDASYSFTPTASDVDAGDTATFSIANQPTWATFDAITGTLTGTPTNSDVGLTTGIVISVADTAGANASLATFSISVSNTNDALVISGTPNTSVAEDASYSFTPSVTDEDSGDSTTFSINNPPSWASFDTATGALTGVPVNSDAGSVSNNIVISVTDSGGAISSLPAFNITVINTNDAVVIAGTPATNVDEDDSYSFTPTASDEDIGDTTTFSINNQPSWANFDAASGALQGTPTNSDVGINSNIVISVTDSGGAVASLAPFSITIHNTNDAPVISGIPNAGLLEGQNYSFIPTSSDDDSGDTLLFAISNKPNWANFNTSTGALSGIPGNDDVGTSNLIAISVSDSANLTASLDAFTITVRNTNNIPVITGAPPNTGVLEDEFYSFTPTVTELDVGDTLLFSINNIPPWASFDTRTGTISGTPLNSDVGWHRGIGISVSDTAGASVHMTLFDIFVTNTNDAPTLSGTPATTVAEDTPYSFTLTASDEDVGDTITFSISNTPTWASFNTASGALTGIPTNDNVGVSNGIVISATDNNGAITSLPTFSLTVTNTNDALMISGTPAASVDEDANYSFTPVVSDVDTGDTVTFSINNPPIWASFDTATGLLTGLPANNDVGLSNNILISATDSGGAIANLATFNITVNNTNDAPVISGVPNDTVSEDSNYSFTPVMTDVDNGDSAVFSVSNQPSWASFDTATGALTGIPSNSDVGLSDNIVISVSDSAGAIDSLTAFGISVVNTNDLPQISGSPALTVAEDTSYSFTPVVSDVDLGDTATFSITNQPTWASFDTTTGLLSGIPVNDDVGLSNNIVINATDSEGATASLSPFNITVTNTNDAPIISGTPNTTVNEDSNYSFTPVITDVDTGDSAVFSVTNQPSWASFNATTGALTGTPSNSDVGLNEDIVISVSDLAGAIANLPAFNISIVNTNDLPQISGSPALTVAEDTRYSFTPTVSDPDDDDNITFSVSNKPAWASLDITTGALTGTPTNSDVGIASEIVITASDDAGGISNLPAFSITVTNVNDAPEISGAPTTTANEGEAYSFTPTVNDVDSNDSQIFTIVNRPVWASFDNATGTLTGTPSETDIGVHGGILISVSDSATASASLAVFSINVNNINDAPVISGTPEALANEDASYSFIPTVDDSDVGDIKIFSIVNPPVWLTFNPSNGALSGIPSDDDIGVAAGIIITVTDLAGVSDSLPAFSITVINVNDVPNAADDAFVLDQSDSGYLLDVLQNDSDDDGDDLTIVSFQSALGSLSLEDGQLRFVSDFSIQNVEFEYLVSDGNGGQDSATVTLAITPDDTVTPGPTITVPDDVSINASGLFTRVDLGIATAVDVDGNSLSVSLIDNNRQFTAGSHKVYWQATDANDASTVDVQEVSVNPLVSFSSNQQAIEDSNLSVLVTLSGEAPEYPLIVPYQVSGTADAGDHNLVDGELTLTSTTGEINLTIFADGVFEETETIILSFTDAVNQGSQNTHTIEIVDGNVAPQIALSIVQDGVLRLLIDPDGGLVVVTATVSDINPADMHSFTWQFLDEVVDQDDVDNSFSFDPSTLVPDLYDMSVQVLDDGIPSEAVSGTVYFEIADILPTLTSADSDGDLIPDNIEGFGDDDGDGIPNYLDSAEIPPNVIPSDVGEQGSFLIEGPAGATLRKGRFSAGNEDGGGVLSADDADAQFTPDPSAQNIGALFDFVIYGLSVAGDTYSIALPQQEAIPAAALYRKYNNGVWIDFVIDDNNQLFSTIGESGYCPPPESAEWELGLTEGHWCVQLSIEDGGPNDDDGEANGAIVDPGGVAVILSDNHFPVVIDDTSVTELDTFIEIDVLANDTDEDSDILSITTSTANIGSTGISNRGQLIYTPPEGFVGTDSVIYSITDGNGGSASGTLVIEIVEPAVTANPDAGTPNGSTDPNAGGRRADPHSGGGSVSWIILMVACLLSLGRFGGVFVFIGGRSSLLRRSYMQWHPKFNL